MAHDERIENTAVSLKHLLSPRYAPSNIEARLARAFDPPVRELNEWVASLRADTRLPAGAGATIPLFDPRGGGSRARVLFLMQDPSEVATFTGFISPDNNDRSAHNSTVACDRAGLGGAYRVHWNIFPWWVNIAKKGRSVDPSRPPQTYAQGRALAARLFADLLGRLDQLRVVVLLGNQAQEGYDHLPAAAREVERRGLTVLRCPSCSPQSWNNVDPADPEHRRRSEIIVSALRSAAAFC